MKNKFVVFAAALSAAAYFLSDSETEKEETLTTRVGTVSVSQCVKGRAADKSEYGFELRFDLGVTSDSQSDYETKVAHMQTKEPEIKRLVSKTASDIGQAAKFGLKLGYDISRVFETEAVKTAVLVSIDDLKTNFAREVGLSYVVTTSVVNPQIGCSKPLSRKMLI